MPASKVGGKPTRRSGTAEVRDTRSKLTLPAGILFLDPLHRLGLDLVGGAASGVLAAAARQPADGADAHVVVAQDLAAQPDAGQAAGRQDVPLGYRHSVGLAGQELHPAGR